jgi:hypothetical protein
MKKRLTPPMLLFCLLLLLGCGEKESRLDEVERYHEEMDGPDSDVLLFTEQIRRWADGIAELEPELVGGEAPGLIREARTYQETAYEFGDYFDSARYETEEIEEFQDRKVELLARLQEALQSLIDDFLKVYRFSPEDEEALPGYHAEWVQLSCKNFVEAVEAIEGEFTRGRRKLLSQFILMGER